MVGQLSHPRTQQSLWCVGTFLWSWCGHLTPLWSCTAWRVWSAKSNKPITYIARFVLFSLARDHAPLLTCAYPHLFIIYNLFLRVLRHNFAWWRQTGLLSKKGIMWQVRQEKRGFHKIGRSGLRNGNAGHRVEVSAQKLVEEEKIETRTLNKGSYGYWRAPVFRGSGGSDIGHRHSQYADNHENKPGRYSTKQGSDGHWRALSIRYKWRTSRSGRGSSGYENRPSINPVDVHTKLLSWSLFDSGVLAPTATCIMNVLNQGFTYVFRTSKTLNQAVDAHRFCTWLSYV